MQQDLDSNPSLSKQYGSTSKTEALAKMSKPVEEKPKVEKKEVKPVKPVENPALKRKSEQMPEAKIGKWETVKTEPVK